MFALNLAHKHVVRFTAGGRHWARISNIQATMSTWLFGQLKLAFPGYSPVNRTLGTIVLTVRLG
jgi:hypothetical protein